MLTDEAGACREISPEKLEIAMFFLQRMLPVAKAFPPNCQPLDSFLAEVSSLRRNAIVFQSKAYLAFSDIINSSGLSHRFSGDLNGF